MITEIVRCGRGCDTLSWKELSCTPGTNRFGHQISLNSGEVQKYETCGCPNEVDRSWIWWLNWCQEGKNSQREQASEFSRSLWDCEEGQWNANFQQEATTAVTQMEQKHDLCCENSVLISNLFEPALCSENSVIICNYLCQKMTLLDPWLSNGKTLGLEHFNWPQG